MIFTLSIAVLTVSAIVLLLASCYLVILSMAAVFGRRSTPPAGPAARRFAILIPAHNEEALLGRLLENLHRLDYPRSAVDIYVVADNSDDGTAPLARSSGAHVYERFDLALQGKGYALRWLLQQLSNEGQRYDAYVIVDGDSVLAENFLRRMDAGLEAGSQVIQAYYSVLNPSESSLSALRYAALAALHYLRPLGRSMLGLSCGLKGNGMCFEARILERFGWRWFTLAEDVELHLELIKAGVRVDFAADTWVRSDMPITFAQAGSQNERWERGRLHLVRTRVSRLFLTGLRGRSLPQLDAAADQLIPPLSIPFALASLCLSLSIALGAAGPAVLAGLALAGQLVYLLCGLALVRAPFSVYRAFGYAPLYVVWKLGLYARALVNSDSVCWVRTARTPMPNDRAHADGHLDAVTEGSRP
jgi:cellulose synthase/poly-beta-1,6-N-acetylglucosamine synthase-like glycosyltransferase